MLMTLGLFVFSAQTLPFNERQSSAAESYAKADLVGRDPAYQHTGPNERTMSISGVISPEIVPLMDVGLAALEIMRASGKSWAMVDGTGLLRGYWIIDNYQETQNHLRSNGRGRRVEFRLSLKRASPADIDLLGDMGRLVADLEVQGISLI